jgi:pyruvate dehydrogenase E2 component (dihydrolipoamide acetyltransferase)
MASEFKLQDPGEGIHEAEILDLHVSESDQVHEDDILLTIETDKASFEVPSPFDGRIEEIRVKEGDIVMVGDVLMTYVEGEQTGEEAGREVGEEEEYEDQEEVAAGEGEGEGVVDRPGKKKEAKRKTTVSKKREQAEAKSRKTGDEEEAKRKDETPVPASPATRRLARELNVDLHAVEGSGPGGRVTADDVRSAAEQAETEARKEIEAEREEHEPEAAEPEPAEAEPPRERRRLLAGEPPPLPDFSEWGEIERIPLRSVRRATARRMELAWQNIPHVTHWDVADITDLERFRAEHEDTVAAEGGKLTLTALFMKAAIAGLKKFPRFNATLDLEREEIIIKHYYHIGVAVATERGLLVPVIRDVDCKTVLDLALELTELAERARQGDIDRAEMRGGSFTLTNPGALGGKSFTPIINYPQVAILGLAKASLEAVVSGDLDEYEIRPRLRLPLGLTFDHRVNDGAEAARFVNTVIDALGDPEDLLLTT